MCQAPLNRIMYICFLIDSSRFNPRAFIFRFIHVTQTISSPTSYIQKYRPIGTRKVNWSKSVMQPSFLCFELPNSCISTQSLFQMHSLTWILCGWMTWLWSWACWWCLPSCLFSFSTSYWEVNVVGKVGSSNDGCLDIQEIDFLFLMFW